MVLADALSRLPNKDKKEEIELDNRVDSIMLDDIDIIDMDLMNFPMSKQTQIREHTSRNPVLNGLIQIILTGWPERMQELPTDLRDFWGSRDELAVQQGIILRVVRFLFQNH